MPEVDLNRMRIEDAPAGRPSAFSWKLLLAALVVLALLGWFGYRLWQEFRPRRVVRVAPVVTRIGTVEVRGGSFEAAGWVEPDPFAHSVPSLIEGWVTEVHVLEGQAVKKGDPLVELYDKDYKLQVEMLEAKLVTLRADLEYWKTERKSNQELFDAGALDVLTLEKSKTEVARKTAVLRETELSLELARRNAERCRILAPRDGVVLRRHVEPGQHLGRSGFSVVSLYDPARIQVRVDINLVDLQKVQKDQQCEIRVESAPDTAFRGRVLRLVHRADIAKNTVQAKVRVLDPDPLLKPEVLVRVRFLSETKTVETDESTHLMFIPGGAVVREGDQAYVFVVQGSGTGRVAGRVAVEVGEARHEDLIEIRSGLNLSSKVIVSDPGNIREGEPVRLREE